MPIRSNCAGIPPKEGQRRLTAVNPYGDEDDGRVEGNDRYSKDNFYPGPSCFNEGKSHRLPQHRMPQARRRQAGEHDLFGPGGEVVNPTVLAGETRRKGF